MNVLGKSIRIEIERDLIIHVVREFSKFENVEVDLLGDTLRMVFKAGALVFKIPITVSLRLSRLQKGPEDPIEFEIIANPLVKSVIKDFKGNSIEMDSNHLRIYPSRMFSLMKNFVVDGISFEEDGIVVTMKLHEGE